jgi:LPPG:FO 2-phospho-L-lactate transferase
MAASTRKGRRTSTGHTPRITVLAGGVGAARFLRGLLPLIEPRRLTVVVNTTDDETFFGLHVSPDLDTVTYTLAGVAERSRGWGLQGDTFHCLEALGRYHDETWFQLGDRDFATHLFRSAELRRGRPLSAVTRDIGRAFGLECRILPMSDDPVRTRIEIGDSAGRRVLAFQEYLVKHRARGDVRAIRLAGIGKARPAPGVLAALRRSDAIILPPSNPFVSILPILRLGGVRDAIRQSGAPVAAISPLIGGAPVKGPLDRMLAGTGHAVSSAGIAALYAGVASTFVVDRADAAEAPRIAALGMTPVVTDTFMKTPARARKLAQKVLGELIRRVRSEE